MLDLKIRKMRDNLPKISIVMPCLNSVDFIERSIRSVIEQEYKNIELFIKDGGSSDGTLEIIRHYAKKYPRLLRWISEKDKGQADAINKGMKKVNGDILTHLNADDVYKEGALRKVSEYFMKNPNVMWAYGKADIINANDKEIRRWITLYKNFWLKNYSYNTLLVLNYISSMACFWRKEAAKEVGESDINQPFVIDYHYWLRLGKKYKAGVINEYLSSFRISYSNKSSIAFVKQFQDEFNVAKRFTNNNLILFLHLLHYNLIIFIYSILKIIKNFTSRNSNIQGSA
ncbi:glycosyltransferase [Candidatus Daviesbacteria bacterium]|nr:glycosyltransferase [Candidatus Daviesbacteria bacterium]